MVQITINEKKIEVAEGTTILRAAQMAGIHIPTLCDHKELTPYGGCRLCIVDVEKWRVPMAACTLPVSEGMVVHTETEAIKKSREFILSMLFSERNHFCPFCQVSGGDCELQNSAYDEDMTHWPIQPGWNNFKVDSSHPYFILDNNRCILCRRCVRACAELTGNFTLSVAERGAASTIVADTDVPLGESTCIKCGMCVQVCPTGALIDRGSAYLGHVKDFEQIKSVCVGCSVGCSVNIMIRNNRIVRIEGDFDGAVNHGLLCEHGRYHPTAESRKRITTPQIRKNGKLEPVSWEEALSALTDKLQPLAGDKNGIAAIASTRLPVEALAMFKELFADKFQGTLVTSTEEGIPTAATSSFAEKNGAFEGKLEVLRSADTVLCIGANVNRSHMVVGSMFKRNLPKGTRLINIGPDTSELDYLASTTITTKPGSDMALIKGFQAIIVKEGLARAPMAIADADLLIEQAVSATGASREQLSQTAQTLARSITPVIIFGKGITAQRDENLVEEIYRLAVLIGAVDSERLGLISVKGEANSLAASLLGLDTAFKLNGQKAVYVALGDDYASKSLIERVSKAPYLVAQACYESDLTEKADVVLPVTIWSEQEGHYINLDGHMQKAQQVLTAPKNVRDNMAVFSEVAKRANMALESDWQEAILERKSSVSLN